MFARVPAILACFVPVAVCSSPHSTTAKFAAISLLDPAASKSTLSTSIGSARRRSEPLFGQDKPWEPRLDNGYPNVVYDPADPHGAWRLWYGGCGEPMNCRHQFLMYANSSDGLTWEKPSLGRYDATKFFPSIPKSEAKDNNIIMYGGGLGVFRDAHESDPAKRFKVAGGSPAGCFSPSGSTDCIVGTAGSPDGLANWSVIQKLAFPKPWRPDCHTNAFWDETTGQYFMTTRDYISSGRSIALGTSTPKGSFEFTTPPALVETGVTAHQLYSQITFRFYNIFLGIVMVYDETSKDGRVHCRLSWWSGRASDKWMWVDKGGVTGKEFIPAGPPGSYDSHICFAAHSPIADPATGNIRLYYMGGNGPHNGARNESFSLATLRPDGYAGLSGTGKGTTIALKAKGTKLTVTADMLGADGSLTVAASSSSVGGGGGAHQIVGAPITKNVTDFVALDGLTVGQKVTLKLSLTQAMLYTVGFAA